MVDQFRKPAQQFKMSETKNLMTTFIILIFLLLLLYVVIEIFY